MARYEYICELCGCLLNNFNPYLVTDDNEEVCEECFQEFKDEKLEDLWIQLDDIPFDEDKDGDLILSEDWHIFNKGIEREYIWHWFDEEYSGGLAYLMHELNKCID